MFTLFELRLRRLVLGWEYEDDNDSFEKLSNDIHEYSYRFQSYDSKGYSSVSDLEKWNRCKSLMKRVDELR